MERALRGAKRIAGAPPSSSKLPITLPLLRALLAQLPAVANKDATTYHAAFCLAFACFLRSGELTWTSFDPQHSLSVACVAFADNKSHALITLPASKTNPFRKGVRLVAPAVGGSKCPVTALQLVVAGKAGHEPLFMRHDGAPFSRDFFVTTLRRCLLRLGIAADAYCGHSFRRGAATWAATQGCNEETIKTLGRWDSNCYRRYVDRTAQERAAMARTLYSCRSGPLVPTGPSWRDL